MGCGLQLLFENAFSMKKLSEKLFAMKTKKLFLGLLRDCKLFPEGLLRTGRKEINAIATLNRDVLRHESTNKRHNILKRKIFLSQGKKDFSF